MNKEEKQRNFFKSIIHASEKAKEEEYYTKEGIEKYKKVELNISVVALEEIKTWLLEVER